MLVALILFCMVFPIGAIVITQTKKTTITIQRERQQKFMALPAVPGAIDKRQTADTVRDLPCVVIRPRMTAFEGLPAVAEPIELDLL